MSYLRRFGSVTVLNGHIHQIVQKVEGNITFHTTRSTAYPQPTAGSGPGPGPLKVPSDQLPKMLGSHALDQGDAFTFKFDKPGTYKYICSIHPKMRVAIVVQ
jgi:plastocyanin